MKKIYFLCFIISLFLSGKSIAQFYDGFTGSAGDNIGGNCIGSTCNNNGWYTHSNGAATTGTIDILAGSLTYPGLLASTGNRISLPGNNTTVPRDINAAAIVAGNVAYYSFLFKVVDNTQLSASSFDYFMHLAPNSGNTFSAFTYTGRLGIKSVNSGTNYHLGIENIGTSYTEYTTDLNFGSTYLVVVKVDLSTTPNITASLWVNPSSLGDIEPAAMVSNSAGTGTSSFGSICLRNGSGTPKAEIDEIRVGSTWAQVTPAGVIMPIVTATSQSATTAVGQTVNVQSNLATGKVYIILNGVTQVTQADLDAAVTAKNGASATISAANTDIQVSTTGLTIGTYYAYAVDGSGNVSAKGANAIVVSALVINPPAAPGNLTATAASTVQVNLTWADNSTDEDNFKIETSADGNTWSPLATVNAGVTSYSHTGLTEGTKYYYRVYATNVGGNSNYSNTANATTLSSPPVVTAIAQTVNNIGQSAKVQSNKATGSVYIILSAVTPATIEDLDAAVTAKKGAKAAVIAASTDIPVSASGLNPGIYYAYAVDGLSNLSVKGASIINVTGVVMNIAYNTGLSLANVYVSGNNLVIEVNGNFSKATAEIFDLVGRKVATYPLFNGINTFSPDVKGIFLVGMIIDGEIVTKKLYLP